MFNVSLLENASRAAALGRATLAATPKGRRFTPKEPDGATTKGRPMAGRKTRGLAWIAQQRSPRYDIWVGNTQVASPWYYRPGCMNLWDEALGWPMTQLHGQPAGNVIKDIARAAQKLRARRPGAGSGDLAVAAGKLEWMRHLCACDSDWLVRVETPAVVSYFELVQGVLDGTITRAQAVLTASERGGPEKGIRMMLNWAYGVMNHEADLARCAGSRGVTRSASRQGRRLTSGGRPHPQEAGL